jgi:hypothetical protein
VLVLTVTIDELKALALDQVSGFLLSLADGTLTVEAIPRRLRLAAPIPRAPKHYGARL